MIQITATDFKLNLGKYLALAGREEIHITKNGADIAVLSAPKAKRCWVDDLNGIVPDDGADYKLIREERLMRKLETPKRHDKV